MQPTIPGRVNTVTSTSLAPTTDRTASRRRSRPRKLKVWGVSLELDETASHWLVWVSPSRDLVVQGISPHRARLAKCSCETWSAVAVGTKAGRCSCGGWNVYGIAVYIRQLLKTYPKVTVEVPGPNPVKERQRVISSLRWDGAERGWVAVA